MYVHMHVCIYISMLSGYLSPRHGVSLGCGWRRQPLPMVESCECV